MGIDVGDPTKSYGFVGVVVDVTNLAASIWTWHRDGDTRGEPRRRSRSRQRRWTPVNYRRMLKAFEAVPPLVTDIDLSLDDKYLYVSCWATGELHQYDVSDPMHPKLAGNPVAGFAPLGQVLPTEHPGIARLPPRCSGDFACRKPGIPPQLASGRPSHARDQVRTR